MSDDPSLLDLAKARRAVETANGPSVSLADALMAARMRRIVLDEMTTDEQCAVLADLEAMDPGPRPKDRKGAEMWDRMQAAKARASAYDRAPDAHRPSQMPAHQPAGAEPVAVDPEPVTAQQSVVPGDTNARERQRMSDAERKIRAQQYCDEVAMRQRESREEYQRWLQSHPWID